MIYLIVVLLMLYPIHNKVLATREEKHFLIEVGQAYSQNIPLLFTKFQHSKIEQLKRETPYYERPICMIRQSQKGIIRQINAIEHTNSSEMYRANSKIIYTFEELRAIRVFIDAIQIQSMLAAIYTSSQIILYTVQQKTGMLHTYQKHKILNQSIQEAKFVTVGKNILLFTPKVAFKIHLDGNYQTVSGYQPFIDFFDDVKVNGDNIYVGGGDQGLVVYKFNQQSNSLSLIANTTFYMQENSSQISLDVNQLQIDTTDIQGHAIYILDREQGLFSYSLSDLHINGSVSKYRVKVLMGGCQHFVVTTHSIYLTCPELIIINKKGVGLELKHNSFSPYEIHLLGERVYIYGYQQLAVYDLFGTVLQQHALNSIAQKSLILGDYIISFSDARVSSSRIIPERQELYCYTSSEDRAGKYTGRYVTSGLCSEYFFGPQDNQQICQVSYPFILVIKDSLVNNYKLEIILVGAWILFITIVGLALSIRHHIIHKSYKQLIEQQTNENIQMVPQLNLKKGSSEEVR